ncbi:MAG: hypothetical protein BIFFINMI_00470 [Phycisphaerae bacterium]|nr:hypothetical protein [Phycisphaerae bacterium]
MKTTVPAITLLLIAAAGLRAAEPARLELADGRTLTGATTAITGGKLTFRTGDGDAQAALGDLARLTRLPYEPVGREADGLLLANGDLLEGEARSVLKKKLTFDSVRLGTVQVEQKDIRAIFFGATMSAAQAPPGKAIDEVILRTGSRTPAELRWMDGEKVGLYSPLGALDVSKGDLAWILLKAESPTPQPGDLRIVMTTGERLTGQITALKDGKLAIRWAGHDAAVDWDLVRAIESPGVHLAWLSQRAWTSKVEPAVIGPGRVPAADRNAAGGAISLGGARHDRGMGMRATSRATWELDGTFKRFRATAGLDDKVGAASLGATMQVVADGRVIWEQTVRPGASVEVDLDVSGVRKLELAVLSGPGYEIGDYGDWADARLVR